MSARSLPSAGSHFVIIGAQRCGTTYLYRLLEEHPEIEMARPLRPEPKFFLDPDAEAKGLAAYVSTCFGHKPGARIRGEKGTSYIESEDAARRIAAILPEPRIVVLVRDPIQRAISNYRFSVENGIETLGIAEALTPEAEQRAYDRARISASPYAYLRRGHYIEYLETYLRHVPPKQMFVGVFEEMVEGPAVFDELASFLGAGPFAPQILGEVVNASQSPEQVLEPPHVERLRAHFAASVARLETFLGRAIEAWH